MSLLEELAALIVRHRCELEFWAVGMVEGAVLFHSRRYGKLLRALRAENKCHRRIHKNGIVTLENRQTNASLSFKLAVYVFLIH